MECGSDDNETCNAITLDVNNIDYSLINDPNLNFSYAL